MQHTKTVHLDNNQTVELVWQRGYRYLEIFHQSVQIGKFDDKESLKLGQTFVLADNSQVTVILSKQNGLEVWQNGVEQISGLASGQVDFFSRAVTWLYWYGAIRTLFNLIAVLVFKVDSLGLSDGFIIFTINILLECLIFVGFAYWAQKSVTKLPLAIALAWILMLVIIGAWNKTSNSVVFNIIVSSVIVAALYYPIPKNLLENSQNRRYGNNSPLDSVDF